MPALRFSVPIGDLAARMRERLRSSATPAQTTRVVWQKDSARVIIHLNTLVAKALNGWLLANIELESDPTGKHKLQAVYYLGNDAEGAGLQAAASFNAPTPQGAQLAARWGADLHRVLWDAVLDVIEASVNQAGTQNPNQPLTLEGFGCLNDILFVDVLAGAN